MKTRELIYRFFYFLFPMLLVFRWGLRFINTIMIYVIK